MPAKKEPPKGQNGTPSDQRQQRLTEIINYCIANNIKDRDAIENEVIKRYGMNFKWRTLREYTAIVDWKVNHIEL